MFSHNIYCWEITKNHLWFSSRVFSVSALVEEPSDNEERKMKEDGDEDLVRTIIQRLST